MIDQDIKKFVLRALLLRGSEPLTAREIKLRIRGAFDCAFAESELDVYIAQLEADNYIAGINDELSGTIWGLTPKGKIRAGIMIKT